MPRKMHHPEAIREERFERSKVPNPWKPTHEYQVMLRMRDGSKKWRGKTSSIEAARGLVQANFDSDDKDRIEAAWIFERIKV